MAGAYHHAEAGKCPRRLGDTPAILLPVALETPAAVWTTAGNARWAGQDFMTHDGVDAAGSGAVENSQRSDMETVVFGPATN